MTLKELFLKVGVDDMLDAVMDSYPDDPVENLGGYRKVYDWAQTAEPISSSAMVIEIAYSTGGDDFDIDPYYDVHGLMPEEGDWPTYALDFTPWDALLAMEVQTKNCDLTPAQMLAHVMWEMTFHGFDQAVIKEQVDKLNAEATRINEALNTLPPNPTEDDYIRIGLSPFKLEEWNEDRDED